MPFRILLVAATAPEADNLRKLPGMKPAPGGFTFGNMEISLLITGVGSMATAWSMGKWLCSNQKPDLAINIGIAGSYDDSLKTGEVVVPVSDCFADSGIEDGELFHNLAEAGLSGNDDFPFKSGLLEADKKYLNLTSDLLKQVKAISVNTATGSEISRKRLIKKYNPDIETMEGATFFYICARELIPFLAVRAISNRVELRNKKNWNIPLALENLSQKFNEIILTLEKKK
jgi:futalosine hydrolase